MSLSIVDIEKRTGVPRVRLRYIADSDILPGNRLQPESAPRRPGRGITRTFLRSEAFGMVIALQLLDAGIRRETVSRIMDILGKRTAGSRDPNDVPLLQALARPEVRALEIGDGINIRFHCHASRPTEAIFQSWVQIDTGARLGDYEPLVGIHINVAKLRQLVG